MRGLLRCSLVADISIDGSSGASCQFVSLRPLCFCQSLDECEHELSIAFVHFRQGCDDLVVLKPLSRRCTPSGVFRGEWGFHSSYIFLVREKCKERYSQSVRVFCDRIDAGNGVPVLNSTCVAAQESAANSDIPLTEIPRLAKLF
jgi:hypothetical protein